MLWMALRTILFTNVRYMYPAHGRVRAPSQVRSRITSVNRTDKTKHSVFILEATIDELEIKIDELPISKSAIQRIQIKKWEERAEKMKINFQNEVPNVMTLH